MKSDSRCSLRRDHDKLTILQHATACLTLFHLLQPRKKRNTLNRLIRFSFVLCCCVMLQIDFLLSMQNFSLLACSSSKTSTKSSSECSSCSPSDKFPGKHNWRVEEVCVVFFFGRRASFDVPSSHQKLKFAKNRASDMRRKTRALLSLDDTKFFHRISRNSSLCARWTLCTCHSNECRLCAAAERQSYTTFLFASSSTVVVDFFLGKSAPSVKSNLMVKVWTTAENRVRLQREEDDDEKKTFN